MGEAIEDVLRRDWTARAYDRVATRALEAYGPEITGLLAAQLRSTSDALEVFSMFSDDLWRGLPWFQWQCSLRAWAYKLARNAAIRWGKARARRSRREVPLSDVHAMVAARARTSSS